MSIDLDSETIHDEHDCRAIVDSTGVLRFRNRVLKRSFDILVSAVLLVVFAPLILCAGMLLLLTQGRPIFFVSTRYIGLNRPVRVFKFRTMIRDACSPKHRLNERFMRDGYLDIPLNCEVYTPIGRILERLQIVELPQLLNVLIDGMSLVGNRPLPRANLELLARFLAWEKRFQSPAGITGISQIVGKLNLTPAARLRLESLYSKVYQGGNIIRCDWFIIWHTVGSVLCRNKGITLSRAEALLNSCLPHAARELQAPKAQSDPSVARRSAADPAPDFSATVSLVESANGRGSGHEQDEVCRGANRRDPEAGGSRSAGKAAVPQARIQ